MDLYDGHLTEHEISFYTESRSESPRYRGAMVDEEDSSFNCTVPVTKSAARLTESERKSSRFNKFPSEHDLMEPAPKPLWVEPFCSFRVSDSSSNIVRRCLQTLESMDSVDFLLEEQCCISGVHYGQSGQKVSFRVSVFHLLENEQGAITAEAGSSTYLVEVSRRHGCSLTFRQLYNKLEDTFHMPSSAEESSLKTDFGGAFGHVRHLNEAMPTFLTGSTAEQVPIGEEDIQNIIALAQSPYTDMAREGVSILASVAEEKCNHAEILANPFFDDVLQASLTSTDDDTCRSALLLLMNLLSVKMMAHLTFNISAALMDLLARREQLETLETQRKAAALLSKMVKESMTNIDQPSLDCALQNISDTRTQACLRGLRFMVQPTF